MYQNWPRVDDDYLELLRYIEALNLDSQADNIYNDILKLMVKSFKAESGQICLHDSHESNPHREGTFALNLSWHFIDQYISYYHNLDPFVRIMPDVGAFRNQDLMPSAIWRHCEFNEDFIKPQKVKHLMVLRLLNSDKLVGHMGLFRPASDPGFSQKDLYRAQLMSSMFSRKLQQKQLAEKSRELDLLLKQLKDIPSAGVMVLNTSLNQVYANLKMLEFENYMPAQANHGYGGERRSALPEEVLAECRSLVQSLVESPLPRLETRHITLWQKVEVEIITLPVDLSPEERRRKFYLLLIFTQKAQTQAGHSKADGNFNLTPKEIEISQYVCQGLTNREISSKLFISLPTVATHVQHILHKAGIARRSQLINRLKE